MSRNDSDVKVIRVTRVPMRGECSPLIVTCESCGNVPISEDVENELQLNMVSSPDRDEPLFLGPNCTEGEKTRYLSARSE